MRWEQDQETLRESQAADTQQSLADEMEGKHSCLSLSSDLHTNKTDLSKLSSASL